MSNKSFYWDNQFEIVRNYNEFVDKITKDGLPEVISFDHDLADEHYAPPERWYDYDTWEKEKNFKEKTGMDCAKWLVDYCMDQDKDLPQYFIHSMNPVGGRNIWEYLENYRKFREEEEYKKQNRENG
jgi:hypothetical protein